MKPEEKMIYEEYHGSIMPFVVLLGFVGVVVAGIYLVTWIVNLIFG